MTTIYLVAAFVLLLGVGGCGLLTVLRGPAAALVALELAGTLSTLTFVCLAVGLQASTYANVAVTSAVLTWIGGLVFVRFGNRDS